MWSTIRQWRYPREFRIAPPAIEPMDWERLDRLARALIEASRLPLPASVQPKDDALLTEIGTGLWRLRHSMLDPSSGRPREEMKRACRHLESTWDSLAQAGVEIQDHTGVAYNPGLALQVLAFQPEPGLSREMVLETIRPSIYIGGAPVQVAQVIVGKPTREEVP